MWTVWITILWVFTSVQTVTGGRARKHRDTPCPRVHGDGWKLQNQEHYVNISGFNLLRRFSLFKTPAVKKVRSPTGSLIVKLGSLSLIRPTEDPSKPSETLAMKRNCEILLYFAHAKELDISHLYAALQKETDYFILNSCCFLNAGHLEMCGVGENVELKAKIAVITIIPSELDGRILTSVLGRTFSTLSSWFSLKEGLLDLVLGSVYGGSLG
ncbi:uncharacterized protein LOC125488242 [Rhincodon typus]|uniref:uncharacterized protein LOC125488242 n=1 Tax=Rhincodon typus TaxID=259920 RepID=UPI002030BBC3|nr:uncharacterized protein LOC125488242 [Rhincodon typus]